MNSTCGKQTRLLSEILCRLEALLNLIWCSKSLNLAVKPLQNRRNPCVETLRIGDSQQASDQNKVEVNCFGITNTSSSRRPTVMRYQQSLLILWLTVIRCVAGLQDFGFARSGVQPYGRPFKLDSLRDSLPNTRLRARRELSRRQPRGKYKYNLKRTAIRDAVNRNALCLGEINKLCYWS